MFLVLIAMWPKLPFFVWIATVHIGGARPALSNTTVYTPSIDLSSGKKDHMKIYLYVTWAMFLSWAILGLVIFAQTTKTCLEIVE